MNLTLIGMPGAGKSTVGVVLAKMISYEFIDTDILIQLKKGLSLQEIVDADGYIALRQIEEETVYSLDVDNSVISTGGSVVYSRKAMEHLKRISKVIFLKTTYATLLKRINDFNTRGLAKAKNQTFEDLFKERMPFYEQYADLSIDCDNLSQEDAAKTIIRLALHDKKDTIRFGFTKKDF